MAEALRIAPNNPGVLDTARAVLELQGRWFVALDRRVAAARQDLHRQRHRRTRQQRATKARRRRADRGRTRRVRDGGRGRGGWVTRCADRIRLAGRPSVLVGLGPAPQVHQDSPEGTARRAPPWCAPVARSNGRRFRLSALCGLPHQFALTRRAGREPRSPMPYASLRRRASTTANLRPPPHGASENPTGAVESIVVVPRAKCVHQPAIRARPISDTKRSTPSGASGTWR